MVADQLDLVVGVDTHLDEHVLAIVAAPSGARVAQRAVPATAAATPRRFAALDKGGGARAWAIAHYPALASGARRCGCFWSRVAAPSTCAAKHSHSCAA